MAGRSSRLAPLASAEARSRHNRPSQLARQRVEALPRLDADSVDIVTVDGLHDLEVELELGFGPARAGDGAQVLAAAEHEQAR